MIEGGFERPIAMVTKAVHICTSGCSGSNGANDTCALVTLGLNTLNLY